MGHLSVLIIGGVFKLHKNSIIAHTILYFRHFCSGGVNFGKVNPGSDLDVAYQGHRNVIANVVNTDVIVLAISWHTLISIENRNGIVFYSKWWSTESH